MKIQDGCDFFCSFCEIPYARGRARSRKFNNIISEAQTLAKAGHQEIVITGINIGTYHEGNKKIMDVLSALEHVQGLERIRISSIEPTTIPTKLIEKMGKDNKLCPYLHIPLQSGSDTILSLMKRKYSFQEFKKFIDHAKATVKDICIGTDVIVGFPGESNEHFLETEERLREAPIDYFHVFSYSQRHMAKSAGLAGKVDARVVKERSRILRDLSFRKRLMFYRSLIGSRQRVLFEQKKNGLWNGLSDNYARVFVRSDKNLENQLLQVTIKDLDGEQLRGELE